MNLPKKIALWGTITAALSVMIGAFGAHALKDFLEASQRTETFETAVRYQFYHALALLLLANYSTLATQYHAWIARLFGMGIIIFAGTLYLLCFTGQKWLGAITPLGGLSFIAAWLLWAYCIVRKS